MINTVTYTGKRLLPLYPAPGNPPYMPIKLAEGTYVYGQLVKETGTPGTYAAVDDAADVAGTHFVVRDTVVDSAGQHWQGQQASNESGAGDIHTLAYAAGGGLCFDTRDLCISNTRTALAAAQVAALGGKLISGTAAAGIYQF